jgi:hypothetical protein
MARKAKQTKKAKKNIYSAEQTIDFSEKQIRIARHHIADSGFVIYTCRGLINYQIFRTQEN